MNTNLALLDSVDDDLTRDQLLEKLSEIRAHAHYVYAFWKGLPKEHFRIRRIFDITANINVEEDENNWFTLQEFLERYNGMHPDDPFCISLIHEKEEVDIEEAEENLLSYSFYSTFEQMTLEQVKNDTHEFLESYCEKCLRENRPFTLSPQTIRDFGFTDEDVKILGPRLDRFNKEAKIKIRAEYEKLGGLDFIRNNEQI